MKIFYYWLQGFLDLKMKLWLRNLVTRCIAIAPSLIACIIGGPSAAARLIIIASVNSKFCYSKQENMPKNRPNSFLFFPFELPFALVPLLKFTSSEAKMGEHKNSIMVMLKSHILYLPCLYHQCKAALHVTRLSARNST